MVYEWGNRLQKFDSVFQKYSTRWARSTNTRSHVFLGHVLIHWLGRCSSCCRTHSKLLQSAGSQRSHRRCALVNDAANIDCRQVPACTKYKGKVSPYSITEHRVPELITVLGSQPAGDVSHKPGRRLPLLSAKPAVTAATLKRAATNFAAW